MTALDVISPSTSSSFTATDHNAARDASLPSVEADTPVFELIHKLMDSPNHRLAVKFNGNIAGCIDSDSLLAGIGNLTENRCTGSTITVECRPTDYSASSVAHAVEDADANLLDMLSKGTDDGMVRLTLRVSHEDPSAVCRSLERYNYNVISAHGTKYADNETLEMRLDALQVYLNV